MDRNAAALPRRQLLTPIAVRSDEVDDAAQASRVDPVLVGDRGSELVDAVIRVIDQHAQRLQVEDTGRPEQVSQIFDRVLARRGRQLVDKRADGEGMRDVVDRAIPADPHMVGRSAVLAAHIGNVVGQVDDALAQLAAAAVNGIGLECRLDRREDGAMQPRIGAAVLVERRFEVLRADRVVVVVLNVVLAGPGHLDRCADHSRQQGGFGDVVRLRLAAKAAAEQRHIDGDVRFVDAEDLGDGLAHLRRVLRR